MIRDDCTVFIVGTLLNTDDHGPERACANALSGCGATALFLPLPISHLCENYLLYQFRIYANSTCAHALIAMEIFHYMDG